MQTASLIGNRIVRQARCRLCRVPNPPHFIRASDPDPIRNPTLISAPCGPCFPRPCRRGQHPVLPNDTILPERQVARNYQVSGYHRPLGPVLSLAIFQSDAIYTGHRHSSACISLPPSDFLWENFQQPRFLAVRPLEGNEVSVHPQKGCQGSTPASPKGSPLDTAKNVWYSVAAYRTPWPKDSRTLSPARNRFWPVR